MGFHTLRAIAGALILQSLNANAVCGSWSQQTHGPTITTGLNYYRSPAIKMPSRLSGKTKTINVSWRILTSSVPHGLTIELCTHYRCQTLPNLHGSMSLPTGYSIQNAYFFRYKIKNRGQLHPAIFVIKNSLTINYCQFKKAMKIQKKHSYENARLRN